MLSDVDNDGQNDVLIKKGKKIQVLTQDLLNANATVIKDLPEKPKGKIVLVNDLNDDGKPDFLVKRGGKFSVVTVNPDLSLADGTATIPDLKKEKFIASGRLKGSPVFVVGNKKNIRLVVNNTEVAKFQMPKKSKVLGVGVLNGMHNLIISQNKGKGVEELKSFPLLEVNSKQYNVGPEISLGELPKGQRARALITVTRVPDAYAVVQLDRRFFNLVLPLSNTGFIQGEDIKGKYLGPK